MTAPDKSNGYEAIAADFINGRGRNLTGVGATEVADWARVLPAGACVLDLGCGTGVPVSLALIERGLEVYGVDAAPTMVAAFTDRFPGCPVQCAAAEESDFFGRSFDGVVSWGLFFLLTPATQRHLIAKAAAFLRPGGRFLFTSPRGAVSWSDAMTGRPSISLGAEAYRVELEAAGMTLVGTRLDEGHNFYYDALKR